MKDAIDFLDRIEGHGYGGTADYEVARTTVRDGAAEIERLRAGLDAAIRCSELALFVIRKQGVMPNSSWEGGFKGDLAKAKAARNLVDGQ